MSFRKERKFRLTSSGAKELKALLTNKGMTLLHPNRKITSQYFDTLDLRAFEESEEGVLPRYKIRVRWYNTDQSILALERKTSSIEGRFKTTKAIRFIEFEAMKRRGTLDKDYGKIFPSVVVSYRRSYFDYQGIRITFDTDIRYSYNRSTGQFRDLEEVVEIKAPFDASNEFLEAIISVPTSRFSKYSRSFLHRGHAV